MNYPETYTANMSMVFNGGLQLLDNISRDYPEVLF